VSERALGQPSFASVVLDVDSTVSGIEGIDWLALARGEVVAREVAELTDRAMRGELPLEEIYGARLAAIRPTVADIDALSAAYAAAVAPGAHDAVRAMRAAGVQIVLVSGGLCEAVLPLARELGFNDSDVKAVSIRFDVDGRYAGFDDASPLTTSAGKAEVIGGLGLPRPVLMVGDGVTDLAARSAVQQFAAFTGFVTRAPVVAQADEVVGSFQALQNLVLGFSLS
jgi:phosphoserine phosphatase